MVSEVEDDRPGKIARQSTSDNSKTLQLKQDDMRLDIKVYDEKSVVVVLYRGDQMIVEMEEEFTSFIKRSEGGMS